MSPACAHKAAKLEGQVAHSLDGVRRWAFGEVAQQSVTRTPIREADGDTMRFPPKEEDAKLLVGWLLTIAGVGLILLTCFLGFLDIGLEGFPAGVRSFHELGEVMEVLAEFTIMFCTGAALLWAGDTCLEDRKRANRLVGRLFVIASVSVTLIFILIELGGPSDLLGPGEKTVAVLAEVTETLCIGAALFWIGRRLLHAARTL